MAYSFDGANDHIDFGSNASIDGFTQQTVAAWVIINDATNQQAIVTKSAPFSGWSMHNAGGSFRWYRQWSGATAQWSKLLSLSVGMIVHLAVVYDGGSTANDPILYIDGVPVGGVTEGTAPSGTLSSDAANNLLIGEQSNGAGDLNGVVSHVVYDNALWSDADINRAKWWGTRGGAVKCFYALLFDAKNRGSAASADGTVTGAVLASLPRVERCWGSLMGIGR